MTRLRRWLLACLGDWLIARAMRTPYWHLRNPDGTPYMDRYWLLRLGNGGVSSDGERQPWIALRVHHIRSSDHGPHFHDHPWSFFSLILRGGYREERPFESEVLLADDPFPADVLGDGYTREFYTSDTYRAGQLLFRRAEDWHRLRLLPELLDVGTWTVVLTLPKAQRWGFLVDGRKVVWKDYFNSLKVAQALARMRSREGALRAGYYQKGRLA